MISYHWVPELPVTKISLNLLQLLYFIQLESVESLKILVGIDLSLNKPQIWCFSCRYYRIFLSAITASLSNLKIVIWLKKTLENQHIQTWCSDTKTYSNTSVILTAIKRLQKQDDSIETTNTKIDFMFFFTWLLPFTGWVSKNFRSFQVCFRFLMEQLYRLEKGFE